MTTYTSWLNFQRRLVSLLRHRDYDTALDEVQHLLTRTLCRDVRSEALAQRADIRQRQGDLEKAREDYLEAHSLREVDSYARDTLELSLGLVEENLGRVDEAVAWYWKATRTSAQGKVLPGARFPLPETYLSPSA